MDSYSSGKGSAIQTQQFKTQAAFMSTTNATYNSEHKLVLHKFSGSEVE